MSIALALVAGAALAACASDGSSSDRAERGAEAVAACREHGGVTAFDDDAIVCRDQTFLEERGSNAVAACRGHGGVSAFDDDIVICGDQTFHHAAGG
jgi:hypothetical protein